MAKYRHTAVIYAESDGTFTFDNGINVAICHDKDMVGEWVKTMLWPLMRPLLDAKRDFKIIVEDGTDNI